MHPFTPFTSECYQVWFSYQYVGTSTDHRSVSLRRQPRIPAALAAVAATALAARFR
jgi:hypothetical protein